MSFWSSQTLKSRLPGLIEPFNDEQIESASYELCLGKEVYISALPDTPLKDRKKFSLPEQKTVPIPPGQFAFLITQEKVSVPKDTIAFISIKFGIKAKGLINVSGFHVDPGYSGHLIFAVYNAGPLNFHIKYGEPLFSIWFADLDKEDESPRKKPGYDETIPTSFMNVPDLVSSLPYLVKRLDDIEKKVEKFSTIQGILFGIVFSITVTFAKAIIEPFIARLFG